MTPPGKTAPGAPRQRGRVLQFHSRKGYGFIRSDDGSKVFVHYSDIRGKAYRTLVPGEEVEFTALTGSKGLQAFDVVRLDPPSPEEPPEPPSPKRTW